jgi:hypothetical protein
MNETNKQEVKKETLTYEKAKVEQILQMLDKISVTGIAQSNIMCGIFNLLNTPISTEK